jgi:hypothetical protein
MANITDIKSALSSRFSNYMYDLFNTYVYGWESDYFSISKTGYTVEVEIKVSKSDFKADFNKLIWSGGKKILKHEYMLSESISKPNKFYFACSEGLIKPEDINSKYGLIHVVSKHDYRIVREAKFLHKNKILDDKFYLQKLLQKFYYRNNELRYNLRLRDCEIKYGQTRINEPMLF